MKAIDLPGFELVEERVLAALGNRLRWQIFRMLAGGRTAHAAAVADAFGRDFDGISKHLRILRSAGVLRSRPGTDRRVTLYFVPAEYRKQAGEIDLGFCVLRVPEAKPDPISKPEKSDPRPSEAPARGFGEMLAGSLPIPRSDDSD